MLRISLLFIFLIVSNAIFLESINQTSFLIKNILKLNYDFREKNIWVKVILFITIFV